MIESHNVSFFRIFNMLLVWTFLLILICLHTTLNPEGIKGSKTTIINEKWRVEIVTWELLVNSDGEAVISASVLAHCWIAGIVATVALANELIISSRRVLRSFLATWYSVCKIDNRTKVSIIKKQVNESISYNSRGPTWPSSGWIY